MTPENLNDFLIWFSNEKCVGISSGKYVGYFYYPNNDIYLTSEELIEVWEKSISIDNSQSQFLYDFFYDRAEPHDPIDEYDVLFLDSIERLLRLCAKISVLGYRWELLSNEIEFRFKFTNMDVPGKPVVEKTGSTMNETIWDACKEMIPLIKE